MTHKHYLVAVTSPRASHVSNSGPTRRQTGFSRARPSLSNIAFVIPSLNIHVTCTCYKSVTIKRWIYLSQFLTWQNSSIPSYTTDSDRFRENLENLSSSFQNSILILFAMIRHASHLWALITISKFAKSIDWFKRFASCPASNSAN